MQFFFKYIVSKLIEALPFKTKSLLIIAFPLIVTNTRSFLSIIRKFDFQGVIWTQI